MIIVWLRRDLRLLDNPALFEAAHQNEPIIPLFIYDTEHPRFIGEAQRWWLHHSLEALDRSLKKEGSFLLLRKGNPLQILKDLLQETGATSIYWNRQYEAYTRERDERIMSYFKDKSLSVQSFNGSLLHEPWAIQTKNKEPFKVFTPFWKKCLETGNIRSPLPKPVFKKHNVLAPSDTLESWRLLPTKPNWAAPFHKNWTPGEEGAHQKMTLFFEEKVVDYNQSRDFVGIAGTSKLSPHLTFGEISPHVLYAQISRLPPEQGNLCFYKELGWREFCYHLLFYYPNLAHQNFNRAFDFFPWNQDASLFECWTKGKTGYPIIDAAMRQLYQEGWMHNRARMIVGSFLTKNLRLPWQMGEKWFWDTLLDADPANNTAGWQWISGSGADASPYFRIFNPYLQSQKFDNNGSYIRFYVEELKNTSIENLHYGNINGYSHPCVHYETTRKKALEAYAFMKNAAKHA